MEDEQMKEAGKIGIIGTAGGAAGAAVAVAAGITFAVPMAIGAGIGCLSYGIIKWVKKD
jgi:hypothetical protein